MPNEYLCSDFYLACYLRARFQLKVTGIKNEGKRKIFIFEVSADHQDVQEMIKSFYNNEDDMVSANNFVREIKDLKTLMYNY